MPSRQLAHETAPFPLSERLGRPYRNWALGKLASERQVDVDIAPIVLENALKLVKGAAEHPGQTLTPSALVDKGWHQLGEANRLYLEYNLREFGTIVWHEPTMEDDLNYPPLTPTDTFNLLDEWGERPDMAVWLGENADCGGESDYTCVMGVGKYAINIQGDLAVVAMPLSEPVL
jgi:hypothetical protein